MRFGSADRSGRLKPVRRFRRDPRRRAAPNGPARLVGMSALLLFAVLAQDPEPAPAVAERTPVAWTDAEARTALAEFKKAAAVKQAKLTDRLAAVEALALGSHKSLVRPLADLVRLDDAVTVRKAAAKALAHQPAKDARPAVLRLLADKSVEANGPVATVVVQTLARLGYEPADWKLLENLFRNDYAEEFVPLQQAILVLAKEAKELAALDLLLEHLDEPIPADEHSPSNPPAEWWEKRWKAWRVWRADVGDALFAITGQRFTTAAEARAWLRKNPPKRAR
jgi:hypothetical protein